jgi:hypothetical protein
MADRVGHIGGLRRTQHMIEVADFSEGAPTCHGHAIDVFSCRHAEDLKRSA